MFAFADKVRCSSVLNQRRDLNARERLNKPERKQTWGGGGNGKECEGD